MVTMPSVTAPLIVNGGLPFLSGNFGLTQLLQSGYRLPPKLGFTRRKREQGVYFSILNHARRGPKRRV
jgi:hypothetical protein